MKLRSCILSFSAALVLSGTAATAQEIANTRMAPLKSPEVSATSVTFRLRAPQAQSVSLSGALAAMDPGKGAMKKDADGVWSLSIPMPEGELYTYNFMVDGVSMLDGQNVAVIRDGSRYMNALLIPEGVGSLYQECPEPGNLEQMWYYSKENDMTRRLYVYTPYGYDRNNGYKKYPVLYLLHGGGGDEDAWATLGKTCQILDNLIMQKKATPMIVVMPNGNPNQYAAQTLQRPVKENVKTYASGFDNYSSLTSDIVPFIEKTYNVIKDKSGRSVAGLSMGGGQSFYIAFRNVDMFSSVGIYSSGLIGSSAIGGAAFNAEEHFPGMLTNPDLFNHFDVIYLSSGEQDNRIDGMKAFYETLKAKGYKGVVWEQYPGAHEWKVWRRNLASYVQMIFKK